MVATSKTVSSTPSARFGLAPPRRFVLPAVLLLLAEGPSHGYGLHKQLQLFRLGDIDRPSTYRALATLECDGLIASSSDQQEPGEPQARRVYSITARGRQALRAWMAVVKEERDCLERVLHRYQATGMADAILEEIDGGWSAALGCGWSAVLPTVSNKRQMSPAEGHPRDADGESLAPHLSPVRQCGTRSFHLVPERSVVMIEVRSTFGPINFGAVGVTGTIDAEVIDGAVRADMQPAARIDVSMSGLRSGDPVYDAELLRRIDARRFPTATVRLVGCEASATDSYQLAGELTFHGVSRPIDGAVHLWVDGDRLVVDGEKVVDVRDFGIPCPTVLMLRFYPDVRVLLHVEAELEDV